MIKESTFGGETIRDETQNEITKDHSQNLIIRDESQNETDMM